MTKITRTLTQVKRVRIYKPSESYSVMSTYIETKEIDYCDEDVDTTKNYEEIFNEVKKEVDNARMYYYWETIENSEDNL